jgi:hypothetical protein
MLLQSGLLQNAIFQKWTQIVARFAVDRYPAFLDRMFELAMTPALGDLHPAVGLDAPDNVFNF